MRTGSFREGIFLGVGKKKRFVLGTGMLAFVVMMRRMMMMMMMLMMLMMLMMVVMTIMVQ